VIADERTTALDVGVQAQIIDLIKAICRTNAGGPASSSRTT
jgi:ABC-type dipeptide/oligopeptide/nickel transport system ATPase component